MPHIHLMTSANLVENVDVPDILRSLVDALCKQDTVNPASVKAYHSLFNTWEMGEGAAQGFAHCQVSILTGRSKELKCSISDAMWAAMKQAFSESATHGDANITLEVREMDAETYRK